MHGDEPDNAQEIVDRDDGKRATARRSLRPGSSRTTRRLKAADPTRPVMLNLGQGVANDEWVGRGPGASLEDYPEYVKGCDIVSFDIYPVAGLERHGRAPTCSGTSPRASTGSRSGPAASKHGLELHRVHAHQQPQGQGHAPPGQGRGLDVADPRLARADLLRPPVQAEVQRARPARRSGDARRRHRDQPPDPRPGPGAQQPGRPRRRARSARPSADVPIDVMTKQQGKTTYVFAVGMRNAPTRGTFEIKGLSGNTEAEVLGEKRPDPDQAGPLSKTTSSRTTCISMRSSRNEPRLKPSQVPSVLEGQNAGDPVCQRRQSIPRGHQAQMIELNDPAVRWDRPCPTCSMIEAAMVTSSNLSNPPATALTCNRKGETDG